MSTTPLTLPTLEELLAAFPLATDATRCAENTERVVRFGKKMWALIYIPANAPDCFACTLQSGRHLVRAYHKGSWQQCVESARAKIRVGMVKEAEKAQAAVAALDEAMDDRSPGPDGLAYEDLIAEVVSDRIADLAECAQNDYTGFEQALFPYIVQDYKGHTMADMQRIHSELTKETTNEDTTT